MSHGKAILISLAVTVVALAIVVRSPLNKLVFPATWTPTS